MLILIQRCADNVSRFVWFVAKFFFPRKENCANKLLLWTNCMINRRYVPSNFSKYYFFPYFTFRKLKCRMYLANNLEMWRLSRWNQLGTFTVRSNYFLASLITSKSNDINSPKKRVWHLINYSYQLSPLTRGVGSRSTFITSCSICAACTEQKKGGFVRKNERKKKKKQERDAIFLNFTQLTPICKFNIWSLGKFSNYQLFPKVPRASISFSLPFLYGSDNLLPSWTRKCIVRALSFKEWEARVYGDSVTRSGKWRPAVLDPPPSFIRPPHHTLLAFCICQSATP